MLWEGDVKMQRSAISRVHLYALIVLSVVAVSAVTILATEATYDQVAEYQPDGNGFRPEVPMRAYPAYRPVPLLGGAPLGATLTPESLDVWLGPGQSVVEDKLLFIPKDELPTQADILICFDLTGSMGGELEQVKINAIDIMEGVRALIPDTYFGVISHQDYPGTYSGCGYGAQYGDPADGDSPYMLNRSLTSDVTAVHNAINALALGDGSDAPESYSRALSATYTDERIGWRRGARKIVIQWGDNVPHDCLYGECNGLAGTTGPDPGPDGVAGNGDDLKILDVVNAMDDAHITLVSMYSGWSEDRLKLWNCLAGRTGGEAFEINPDGTVANDVDLTDYIVSAIGKQFKEIGLLTLEVCDPEYEEWLVDVDPDAYHDVVLDEDHNFDFTITIEVPEGTEPGDYCFDICAVGDGAVYAKQSVCIHVRPEGCFELGIGDVTGNAGDIVRVPVTIQDATGWGIHLLDIDICWCPEKDGVLSLAGFVPGPVLIDNELEVNASQTGRNCLSFIGKSETALEGGGTLFYVDFAISEEADPCDCCDVIFASVNFNNSEFIDICPEDGSVCLEHCQIDGYVHNWYCNEGAGGPVLTDPLYDVEMLVYQSCGDALPPPPPLATTHTDESGYFAFECLAPLDNEPRGLGGAYCEYCVRPGEAEVPDGWITAYDASLVLRYLHEQDMLNDCPFDYGQGSVYPQQIAGDVDCGDGLQQVDVDLILQYVVGLITEWPGCSPWIWVPEMQCTPGCPDALDFIGVLKGDVSGPMPDPVLSPAYIKVGIPRHYYQGEVGFVEVPIQVRNAEEVFSVEFLLHYDQSKLTVVSVEPAGLAHAYNAAYNDLGGAVDVALAGFMSFSGSGRVALVTFRKNDRRVPIAHTELGLDEALFNEGDPPAVIEGHSYDGEIVRFALGPVSPNPFRDGTVISYNTPETAAVALKIFNVHGQAVCTVFDGTVSAGMHQITWDGRDDSGARVARGVYFCRMEAGAFTATEKLVFLE
jgi:hypothetical protein